MVTRWNTWKARIGWIQSKTQFSENELSRKAGLTKGAIGALLTREAKNGSADMKHDNAIRLAKAVGVNVLWLEKGLGSPDDEYSPESDPELVVGADTVDAASRAMKMLIQLDNVDAIDAIDAVNKVRTSSPTADGLYRAARLQRQADADRKPIGAHTVVSDKDL